MGHNGGRSTRLGAPVRSPHVDAAVRRQARPAQGRPHRCDSVLHAVGWTLLSAVVPGAGFLHSRRQRLGAVVLVVSLRRTACGWRWRRPHNLRSALDLAFDPSRLTRAAVVTPVCAGAVGRGRRRRRSSCCDPAGTAARQLLGRQRVRRRGVPRRWSRRSASSCATRSPRQDVVKRGLHPQRRPPPGPDVTAGGPVGRSDAGSTCCCSAETPDPTARAPAPTR